METNPTPNPIFRVRRGILYCERSSSIVSYMLMVEAEWMIATMALRVELASMITEA